MSSGKIIRLRRLSWSEVMFYAYIGVLVGWTIRGATHRHEIKLLKREVA